MRPAISVFALAVMLALAPRCGFAAGSAAGASATGTSQVIAVPSPPASELATPESATPESAVRGDSGELSDPDAPPPFMRRPKVPPRSTQPDMTYATRPAPADFRGLPWGAALATATARLGLKPVTSPVPLRDTYYRPDETLRLGPAELVTVAYYFHKGAFSGAGIVFAGEANYFLVKDHLIEQYGPGRQVGEHYGWTWTHVNIDMRLRDGMGELRYTYEP
ncbi:MAG: hypothetical protein AUJ49_04300 [Desulfovibrionaceae bacterium CG1_02_65_16]|nr:MAG: hypothetical protein AUJ49_04300 [Desulfovibrionaceae bacterium CG1_02_65_16]